MHLYVFEMLLSPSLTYKDTRIRNACYLLSWPLTDTGSRGSARRHPRAGSWLTSLGNTWNSVPSSYATVLTWSAWQCWVRFALMVPIWLLLKTILCCLSQPHAEMGTTEPKRAASPFIVPPSTRVFLWLTGHAFTSCLASSPANSWRVFSIISQYVFIICYKYEAYAVCEANARNHRSLTYFTFSQCCAPRNTIGRLSYVGKESCHTLWRFSILWPLKFCDCALRLEDLTTALQYFIRAWAPYVTRKRGLESSHHKATTEHCNTQVLGQLSCCRARDYSANSSMVFCKFYIRMSGSIISSDINERS
jgi:hypothetical protein